MARTDSARSTQQAPAGLGPRRRTLLLKSIVRGQGARLAGATALFVGHQIGEVLVPVVAGALIDRAVVTGDATSLARWLVLLATAFAVLSTAWRWGDRLLVAALEDAGHDLRVRLARRLVDPGGAASIPAGGEVVSIATIDVDGAVRVLVAVAAGVAAVVALLATAVVLLAISIPLGLVVLVGLPAVVVGLQLLVRPLERRTAARRAEAAQAATLATDLLTGIRVLRGLHAEANGSARYRAASRRALDAGLSAARLGAVHEGATVMATGAFIAVVALVAGTLAADGDVSVGGLVAAVGVTQFLVGPLWRIGFAVGTLAKARAAGSRVAAVLSAPPIVADGALDPPEGPGGITFRSVHHRTLCDLDLDVEPGELLVLAVLEPRDAGHLLDLFARADDPAAGVIRLDGVPYPAVRLEALRRTVLVVRHDAAIFGGTLREVVGEACRETLTDTGLEALLEASATDELVHHLPHGLDSPIASRGSSLSGGQQQRVVLARALAPHPRILVLHDPTTAVDPVTEARMTAGIRDHRRGRTTIVLSTSPAMLAIADRVVVVDDGAITGSGSHDDLLARDERYAATVLS